MNMHQLIIQYRSNSTSKKWLLLLLFLIQLPVVAYSNMADDKSKQPKLEYLMKVNSSAIAVVDSNVVVSLQITAIQDVPVAQSIIIMPELEDQMSSRKVELPLIFINSRNQQIYFERELKNEYPDAMALRKKNGEDLQIDYLRNVKYEPWMENAVLKVKKLSCACKNMKDRGEELIGTFRPPVKTAKVAYKPQLFPVYQVPPADKSVKVREEKGSAYINFVVNKWNILPEYMSNTSELQKIHNSVNIVKNDSNVTIRNMVVEGYASPEGANSHNEMLSEKRTEALRNYLERIGLVRGIKMVASGKGENWDGFLKQLRNEANIPQRDKLLSIANANISNDEKEARMRKEANEGFRYMLNNYFPKLRVTNYNVIYTVRPFTVEESEVVFETRPINLNLNEIYKLADKYANNEQKYYSIIRKAYLLYPNDTYINLTMAYLAIKKGEANEAAEYLTKVKACPEKTLNEGLVAYLKGDLKKAVQLVEQAKQAGLQEASMQLEEFKKANKNTNK
jgi:outer membrane protein OmpA-like peptidoglycan-associated protein